MPVLNFLDRHVLWLAPPAMLASAAMLALLIRNMARLGPEAQIMSLPLAPQQAIEFREARRVVLSIEAPRFSMRSYGLEYRLSTEYGVPVRGREPLMGARTRGVRTARREVRVFEVPHPGRYVLRVENLGPPREGDDRHRLIFSRPHWEKTVAHIVGIILSSGVLVVSLVFFALRLKGDG